MAPRRSDIRTKGAIAEIRDGMSAQRWAEEQQTGARLYQRLLNQVMASPLAKAEAELVRETRVSFVNSKLVRMLRN
jgi:ketol-acid reductoisomerase